jgi:UDP-perosamine 4-acetyltransferase
MNKIILMGGGKYAGLICAYFSEEFDFVGYLDDVYEKAYIEAVYGIKKIGTSDEAEKIMTYCPNIVMAIGAEKDTAVRKKYYKLFKSYGFNFPNLIHKTVQNFTKIDNIKEGVVIHPNALIDPEVVIQENCVISRTAVIGHDSYIGDNTFIAPGVILNGSTKIGNDCFIGTGSIVIQNKNIGNNVTIGAGSCVINDIDDNQIAVGVPAKVRAK